MFRLRDKILYALDLILDTAFSLIDISQISEDDFDKSLEKKNFNIIAAEDQNYLKKLRKRNGKYKIYHKGKWIRDLGYGEDLEFIGRDPK